MQREEALETERQIIPIEDEISTHQDTQPFILSLHPPRASALNWCTVQGHRRPVRAHPSAPVHDSRATIIKSFWNAAVYLFFCCLLHPQPLPYIPCAQPCSRTNKRCAYFISYFWHRQSDHEGAAQHRSTEEGAVKLTL
jgi:hypothetical protein